MDSHGPDCEQALRDIERFLDDECDPAIRAFIDRHLADCSSCMEKAEFRRHVKALIASKCREGDVPTELDGRVRALIDNLEP